MKKEVNLYSLCIKSIIIRYSWAVDWRFRLSPNGRCVISCKVFRRNKTWPQRGGFQIIPVQEQSRSDIATTFSFNWHAVVHNVRRKTKKKGTWIAVFYKQSYIFIEITSTGIIQAARTRLTGTKTNVPVIKLDSWWTRQMHLNGCWKQMHTESKCYYPNVWWCTTALCVCVHHINAIHSYKCVYLRLRLSWQDHGHFTLRIYIHLCR